MGRAGAQQPGESAIERRCSLAAGLTCRFNQLLDLAVVDVPPFVLLYVADSDNHMVRAAARVQGAT